MNKLLMRQLKRHFGSAEAVPPGFMEFLEIVSSTYNGYEEEAQLIQNSLEISSQELRDAYDKKRIDAENLRNIIDKIKSALRNLDAGKLELPAADSETDQENPLLGLMHLITEYRQIYSALENERTLFRTIIDLIPDGVYVKDLQGRKTLANPTEVRFSRLGSELEILGKSDFDTLPEDEAHISWEEDNRVIKQGEVILNIAGRIKGPDGLVNHVLCSKVPLRDSQGRITGIVGVTHDITELKTVEEELKSLSARLSLAVKAGGVGVWELDIVSGKLVWDDQMFKLHCKDPDTFPLTLDSWLSGFCNGEDIRIRDEILTAITSTQELDTEFRIPWPDGSVHIIRHQAITVKDATGKAIRLIGTNQDVTAQKKNEDKLLAAKQEADAANRAKSEFLANMSHEIRTPLNGVIGFTDLLLKTPLSNAQKQYAENANLSGHTLLGIINDILDFSKIEAGKLDLELIPSDLREITEQTADIIKYQAFKKGLEILVDLDYNLPEKALVDPVRLKQILVNLISNAVKFTATGEVEIKIRFQKKSKTSGIFRFSIRDTGIGITKEQQKRLFKAFSQADASTTRRYGGTGLGLTISNMLAEKMGSRIELVSEPGSGSTFSFDLETEFEYSREPGIGVPESVKRVMIIDDNEQNLRILEGWFKHWGIETRGFDNGLSALNYLKNSGPFDLILIDCDMPFFNGLDTVRTLRNQLKFPPQDQPVIILKNNLDEEINPAEVDHMGIRAILQKPLKHNELLCYLRFLSDKPARNQKNVKETVREFSNYHPGYSPVVLIAEDVALNRQLAVILVRKTIPNVTILEAKSGQEAYEMAITMNPSLILMDVQMPEMSGIEATGKIREHEAGKGKRVPIIALTAGAIKGEKEKCLEAGMDEFLTKPIDWDSLVAVLNKYTGHPQ